MSRRMLPAENNITINVLSHVPPRHHPRKLVPVHRVNIALTMLRVRQGAVICPSMAEPLVRGFGLSSCRCGNPPSDGGLRRLPGAGRSGRSRWRAFSILRWSLPRTGPAWRAARPNEIRVNPLIKQWDSFYDARA